MFSENIPKRQRRMNDYDKNLIHQDELLLNKIVLNSA